MDGFNIKLGETEDEQENLVKPIIHTQKEKKQKKKQALEDEDDID